MCIGGVSGLCWGFIGGVFGVYCRRPIQCIMNPRLLSFRASHDAANIIWRALTEGLITYADLNAECPFPSSNIVIKITGSQMSAALAQSRGAWLAEGEPEVGWSRLTL